MATSTSFSCKFSNINLRHVDTHHRQSPRADASFRVARSPGHTILAVFIIYDVMARLRIYFT